MPVLPPAVESELEPLVVGSVQTANLRQAFRATLRRPTIDPRAGVSTFGVLLPHCEALTSASVLHRPQTHS